MLNFKILRVLLACYIFPSFIFHSAIHCPCSRVVAARTSGWLCRSVGFGVAGRGEWEGQMVAGLWVSGEMSMQSHRDFMDESALNGVEVGAFGLFLLSFRF